MGAGAEMLPNLTPRAPVGKKDPVIVVSVSPRDGPLLTESSVTVGSPTTRKTSWYPIHRRPSFTARAYGAAPPLAAAAAVASAMKASELGKANVSERPSPAMLGVAL